ncbi:MAG: zinc transport system ATP-binding protein [Tenuifilum sp.]|jgi:zinc transport system ATP-binding protein|uniref:ABC transporter ATP-binding protein n=1 Tax=Tenuifilum thalassicum TaxID=2590900 RepID=A0A7D3XU57_9BACT|nr:MULTISPECIES: ABC transporter ATP-binding protein [Tenuifilum]MDI3525932.1 zinc transport system ATP-binding protein [Tenuifilum sp.]QKG78768.1 ABC transporter ATP-binding protein [Tenuifilum thalassicum]
MKEEPKKLIEIKNVTAGYGNNIVLRDVSLSIYSNDFIGIIGPNGGGKTTLIKLLVGQLKPLSGNIVFHTKGNGSLIGYLPQASQIDKNFPISVMEVILSGLLEKKGIFGNYSRNQKSAAVELMKQVGIDHLKNKSIGQLSGGQLQRVLLCRALISEPQVLILDEPNTYVDNKFEGELYEMLRKLNDRMAIVMVSHDLGTITSYVKTIACVNGTLFYHQSNQITNEQLASYNCPIQIIAHGPVPHTVLVDHDNQHTHNHQH